MTVKIYYTMSNRNLLFLYSLYFVTSRCRYDTSSLLDHDYTAVCAPLGHNAILLQAEDSFSDPQLLHYCLHGSVI